MTVRSLGEAPYLDLFEDHTRLRRLVSRSFRPQAADGHRPFMRELVTELVDGFASTGECELWRILQTAGASPGTTSSRSSSRPGTGETA